MTQQRKLHVGQRGFTLIELIVVIVVGSVMAATITIFLPPAFKSFRDTRNRSDLVDQTDTALRRMLRDVRMAVPNSLRMPNASCFEMVPTMAGGRYRMDSDASGTGDASPNCGTSACSAFIDPAQATTQFDTLTTLSTTPAIGDWIVIDNQNVNDVYSGSNRSDITATVTNSSAAWQGKQRIVITPIQFPSGYTGGRFGVVPNNQKAVFYVCSGADGSVDASGNGKGTLYRLKNYGFNAAYPSACPSTASADVIATNVRACTFIYNPNQGATQQSGFLWLELSIARNNETAYLAQGAHVMNVP